MPLPDDQLATRPYSKPQLIVAPKFKGKRVPVLLADGRYAILLTQGQIAVVDAGSVKLVAPYLWQAHWDPKTCSFYAVTCIPIDGGKQKTIGMHRMITGVTDPAVHVDHRDHDTLDNTIDNLRVCPNGENQRNARPQTGRSSPHKGVGLVKRTGRWRARIRINGEKIFLGYFATEQEAANAYDAAAVKCHGEFAYTNAMAMKVA